MIEKTIKLNQNENEDEFNSIFNYENKVCGLTLLTRLILDGKLKVAKILYNSKIKVDYQHSADGDTALHKAIKAKNKKAIGFCLYIGCSKTLKNNNGESFETFKEIPEYSYLETIEKKIKFTKVKARKSIHKIHMSRVRRKSQYIEAPQFNSKSSHFSLKMNARAIKNRSVQREKSEDGTLKPNSVLPPDDGHDGFIRNLSTIKDEDESVSTRKNSSVKKPRKIALPHVTFDTKDGTPISSSRRSSRVSTSSRRENKKFIFETVSPPMLNSPKNFAKFSSDVEGATEEYKKKGKGVLFS